MDCSSNIPCLGDGVRDGVLFDNGTWERSCRDGDFETEVDALRSEHCFRAAMGFGSLFY